VIVAGVMSGTSADGIDVALVRVQGRGFRSRLELLAHYQFPYPSDVRRAVLAAMNARSASVADLARLNFLLGDLYADAVRAAQRRARLQCELVGCHGQTLYHQATSTLYLGRRVACTWQTGEGAIIAAKIGVPVVSDFRPADLAPAARARPWSHSSITFSIDIAATGASFRTLVDRQPDRNSAARFTGAGDRLRHRPGQHGD